MILALIAAQAYLVLPPGIPFIPGLNLIPFRFRLSNYAMIGLVAYGLYAVGFTFLESVAIASFWMVLGVYLVLDFLYDLPLVA